MITATVERSTSVFWFIYLMAALGCIIGFTIAGLQNDILTATSSLYIAGLMILAAVLLSRKAI